jgi:hypothetical protein
VPDDAIAEECLVAHVGMVNELIGHQQIARCDMLLHAAGRTDRYELLDAELLHPPDVGAIIQLAWQYTMSAAMARQENNLDVSELPAIIGIGRPPEGRFERNLFDSIEPAHLVEAAATDYAEYRFRHAV